MKKDGFLKNVTSNRAYAAVFVTVVCLVMLGVAALIMKSILSPSIETADDDSSSEISAAPAAATVAESKEASDSSSDTTVSEEEPVEVSPADDLTKLEKKLRKKIKDYDGTWTVYVQHLGTGNTISIDSKPIYAASVIKLYCAAAIYKAVEDGNLREDEVEDLVKRMITVSDNYAFDELVQLLPPDYITEWCVDNGYWDTEQNHCIASDWAYQVLRTSPKDNTTSVDDVGELLASIYKGECVSEQASKKIIKLMKKQEFRSKIPAGLPEGVKCGNKTGETDNTCHDSAIIWSDGGDYVLVVMGEAPGFAWSCNKYIVEISKTVYKYFNP